MSTATRTPHRDASSTATLGVHLGAAECAVHPGGLVGDLPLPPAAILPRFVGEPIHTDLAWPPHPRATGEVWPPEARIEHEQTPARFPIAYAWPMLSSGASWECATAGRRAALTPAGAIAHVIAALLHHCGAPEAAIIVPNHLAGDARADLLDTSARLGIAVRPVPRALATARAWCAKPPLPSGERAGVRVETSQTPNAPPLAGLSSQGDRDITAADRPAGTLLCLHLGLDEWELALVDLHRDEAHDPPRTQPVLRPAPPAPLPSYGLEMMHRIADRAIEMSYRSTSPGRVWELVWCTPWMRFGLALLAHDEATGPVPEPPPQLLMLAPHVRRREFLIQQTRHAAQRSLAAGVDPPGLLRPCLPPRPDFAAVREWLAQQRALLARERGLIGAVVTGAMAAIPEQSATLAEHHLGQIWPGHMNVLIEGRHITAADLARAAAQSRVDTSACE